MLAWLLSSLARYCLEPLVFVERHLGIARTFERRRFTVQVGNMNLRESGRLGDSAMGGMKMFVDGNALGRHAGYR